MQFKVHAHARLAYTLQGTDRLAHAAKGDALARGVARLVGADQREGHDVDPAVHDAPGQRLIHTQARRGGGHAASRPARQGDEIHKAGMQEGFAPALQVDAPALAHERPEPGEGFRLHVPRPPHGRLRGVRAVGATARADRGHFHLYAVERAGLAKQAFLKHPPDGRLLEAGIAQGVRAGSLAVNLRTHANLQKACGEGLPFLRTGP